MNSKILLVDDEHDITKLMRDALVNEGYTDILEVNSGEEAIKRCKSFEPDIIVLDVKMPDIDGIEVCTRIRKFSHCPILFLSSKNDEVDKIVGLSSGGDDYITKPFSVKEVIYRIKAHLRRQSYSSCESEILSAGGLRIDLNTNQTFLNDREISLTSTELLLLAVLVKHKKKILSKEQLYEQAWGEYSSICDNTIMVHIRHIREKIEENPSSPQRLVTIKGLGYKLVEVV